MNAWLNSPGHKRQHRAAVVPLDRRRVRPPPRTVRSTGCRTSPGGVSSGARRPPPPPPPAAPPAPAPPPAAPPAAPAAPPAAPKPPASPAAPISSPGSPSSGSSPAETPSGAAAATTEGIGSALLPVSTGTSRSVTRGAHKARSTRLVVTKPHAGEDLRRAHGIRPVRVATENLAVRCRAKLAGKRMQGKGEIADHVATCTWAIPAGARRQAAQAHGQGHGAPRHLARAPREADRRRLTDRPEVRA